MDLGPWYAARDILVGALVRDLAGTDEDDVLGEPPLDRFIIGILHPRAVTPSGAEFTENGGDGADDLLLDAADDPEVAATGAPDAEFDPAVALSRVRYPSSMGLTFAVGVGSGSVSIRASAVRYLPRTNGAPTGDARSGPGDPVEALPAIPTEAHLQTAVLDRELDPTAAGNDSSQADSDADDVRHRGRVATAESWAAYIPPIDAVEIDVSTAGETTRTLAPGLALRVVVRAPTSSGVAITAVLVNTLSYPQGEKDAYCWFRPRLEVTSSAGFVERGSGRPVGVDDDDLESYELLYRSARNLAVGHGCAVEWEDAPLVTSLRTTFVPRYELALADAPARGGLSMLDLAEARGVASLTRLVEDYRAWIDSKAKAAGSLPEHLAVIAARHIGSAREAADRMEAGIALLHADGDAMSAFNLMNRAMHAQRSRQDAIRSGRDPSTVGEQSWRPFQIAFILLNLVGLTSPDSDEREVADLLWFPTGGGKTEAYLGLIGYTILLRRIRNNAHAGVSVIMRYTLRLLTLQQFERAAGLICALELIRREELAGSWPISLGLWVGQSAAPNTVDEARKAINRLRRGEDVDEGNPVQLVRCPWCGANLTGDDYTADTSALRVLVRCPNSACQFFGGLPVHLVDQEVYRERPSLVIGTVDKFAMMAWKGDVAALFSTDGAHPPPDLIVQDELHLISGPLGTMVGLYETAVDAACTRPARPKVVASTATIRRAGSQVRAVFDRRAKQFPPPGLDADDSWFAVQASRDAKGTRQYVGVLAPGVSQATLLVRTYAALLQCGKDLDASDEVRDAYWTLVGYFNSLRVLGSAFMQVIDDVPDRIKVVAERRGSHPRDVSEPRELTSRKKSSEIPTELQLLGTPYPNGATPDVVLATNMISVGVDVDRLGLMAVMGQPQTTAEYIQATSRVGRRYPGLVVVMYNGARSRDLSHYESFATYHRGLYRQVEATGATPFAPRARDRGLHGVLVSLARMLVDSARDDAAAGGVARFAGELRRLGALVADRAERVLSAERGSESTSNEERDRVERQVEHLVRSWEAGVGQNTKYAGWFDRSDKLLVPPGSGGEDSEEPIFPVDLPPWPTLTSLRDVDAESSVYQYRTGRS